MLLDLSDRTVVIVGGGAVAARKARGLVECGAGRVRCVAPTFDSSVPPQVERVAERYAPEHLDGASLVFAATDDAAVNDAIVRDCRRRNVLVNRADADEESPGDFVTPATLRSGELLLSVSAGSPALSAAVRDRLAGRIEPEWPRLADAMRELRPLVRDSGLPISTRRVIFRELASDEALAAARGGGPDAVRAWLLSRHPELNHA